MLHQLFHFSHHKHFIIACSGGVDSMSISNFYHRGNKHFSLAYFHHGTPQADEMQECVSKWATDNKHRLFIGKLSIDKPKEKSPEEFWRDERYKWLATLGYDIITAHHLQDAVEGYLFSCLHGNPKVISSSRIIHSAPVNGNGDQSANILWRPFLTTTKQELIDWATDHNVPWVEDKSNEDVHSPRNRIRHNILNEALKINPGLFKVVKKKIILANGVI